MRKHIVVIGGGMAGTAAAYSLKKKGYDVTILEKNDRLGGRIHSVKMDDVSVELGAAFLTNSYHNVLSFIKEKGLDKQLVSQKSKAKVFKKNTFLSPTALLFSLSLQSKVLFFKLFITILLLWLRIDLKNPGKIVAFDTRSVTDIFSKIKDKQVLEYILQPILNGYCFWTPEQTSQAMLLVMAKFLLKGGRYRLKDGLQQLPEKAVSGCTVLLDSMVTKVTRDQNAFAITIQKGGTSRILHADGVVCATTASSVPRIFSNLSARQLQFFSSVEYSSTVVVAQVYTQQKASKNIGAAIPRLEQNDIGTITVATEKQSSKSFLSALKIYVPGKKYLAKSDEAIIKAVKAGFSSLRYAFLPDDGKCISTRVHRWKEAIPVFQKGSMNRLHVLKEEIEDPHLPLVFAGDYLTGPCIEWAFNSGLKAAERLHERLKE